MHVVLDAGNTEVCACSVARFYPTKGVVMARDCACLARQGIHACPPTETGKLRCQNPRTRPNEAPVRQAVD